MQFSRIWTFKQNGEQLRATEIINKRTECRAIRNKLDIIEVKSLQERGNTESRSLILEKLSSIAKTLRMCDNKFNQLLPCCVASQKDYCPKSLQINWIFALNSQHHINRLNLRISDRNLFNQ